MGSFLLIIFTIPFFVGFIIGFYLGAPFLSSLFISCKNFSSVGIQLVTKWRFSRSSQLPFL